MVNAAAIKARVARWRYVVPNAITCASLTVGLIGCVLAFVQQDFAGAAWLVVLSVLLDKLDGTAARLLKATSAIGVQLDSFADFVVFGIAPGAFLYAAGLAQHNAGQGPWAGEAGGIVLAILCASYVVAACLRLAKFNVLAAVPSAPGAPKVFYGLPSTFAGGLLALCYILADKYALGPVLDYLPVFAFVCGLLMLSNLPLPKLVPRKDKIINILQAINIVVVYVFGILRLFPEYLWSNVILYALIGFGWGIVNRKQLLAARQLDPYEAPEPADDDE